MIYYLLNTLLELKNTFIIIKIMINYYLIYYIELLKFFILICNFIYYYNILLCSSIIYYAYNKGLLWICTNFILLLFSYVFRRYLFRYFLITLIACQLYNLIFIDVIGLLWVINTIVLYVFEILNVNNNIFDFFIIDNINYIFTFLFLYKYI
jgi:hypothetical protein